MKRPLKLLADLNISIKTVSFLRSLGFDIVRMDKSLNTDEDVVELAIKEDRIILTFDKDFGEIYYFHRGKKLSVIVLYLTDQTVESVNPILELFFDDVEFDKIEKKLVILYSGRYRIIG